MNCMSCCKHSKTVGPHSLHRTPSLRVITPANTDETVDERCHKTVLYSFLCVGGTLTVATGGVAAWSFATGSTGPGVLAAISAAGSLMGNVGCCKYATARDMDAIVKDLGYKTLKIDETAAAVEKAEEKFKEEKDALTKQVTDLQGTIATYESSTKVLKEENTQLKDSLDKLKAIRDALQAAGKQQAELNKSMISAFEQFGKESPEFLKTVQLFSGKIDALTKAQSELDAIMKNEAAQADQIVGILKDITSKNTELQTTLNSLQGTFKTRADQIATMEKLYNQLAQLDKPYLELTKKVELVLEQQNAKIAANNTILSEQAAKIDVLKPKQRIGGQPPEYDGGASKIPTTMN